MRLFIKDTVGNGEVHMCRSSSRCSRFATFSGLVAMVFMQSIPALVSTMLHLLIMPTHHPPLLKPSQGKTYSPRPKRGPGGRPIILFIIPPISAVRFHFESLFHIFKRLPNLVLPLNQSAYSTKSELRTWRLGPNKPGKYHTRITPSESTITPGLPTFSVFPGGNICLRLSSTFSCRPEHLLPFS